VLRHAVIVDGRLREFGGPPDGVYMGRCNRLVRQNSLVYGGYSHAKHRHDQKRPDQRPNQKLDEIFAFHLTDLAIGGSPPRDNNVQTQ